ncbi:MAG: hypothetical protein EVA65_15735 [Oceanococcus sp.]|nr:MAG: hypothetical protein EVA65_15735 [Oceanococcus sp.]
MARNSQRRTSDVPRRHEATLAPGDFRVEQNGDLYRACIGDVCTPWTNTGSPIVESQAHRFRVCLGDICSNWVDWPETGTSTGTAAEDLGGHRAVYLAADGLRYASASDTANADATLGITVGAALTGEEARYRYDGELTFPGSPFTPRDPVWLGENGQLTQAPPTGGLSIVVGIAKNDSILSINIQQPIEVL